MRVLLTGGSGMVGRNFQEHPAARDLELRAPRRAELDLRDLPAVQRYMEECRPDIVIHAAGKVGGIHANIREPVAFLLENLDLGRNVVWAAQACGVPRLLNLGSSCMYPRHAGHPLREEAILTGELEPTNEGYALAKITVARLCEYLTRQNPALAYKTLVPCNLYGRHDAFDPRRSHLVAAIIDKLHQAVDARAATVEIWGDGTARREFMFAADLADCLVEAVRRFDSLPALMNVGVGVDYSVQEYYSAAASVIGFEGKFVHDLARPVGMARKTLAVDKAERWGWRAATPLRDGLASTYRYYLEQRGSAER